MIAGGSISSEPDRPVIRLASANDHKLMHDTLLSGPYVKVEFELTRHTIQLWSVQTRHERCVWRTGPSDEALMPNLVHWLLSSLMPLLPDNINHADDMLKHFRMEVSDSTRRKCFTDLR